jgi:ATP-dependent Clp protease ATP-binding subunit ClpA
LTVLERFTQSGREAVALAQAEARELRFSHVGTEALLLGLLRQEGAAAKLLERFGLTVERARVRVLRDFEVDSEKLRDGVNRTVPRPVPGVIVDETPEDSPDTPAND